MTMHFWSNPDLHAELSGELDGWRYTMRFSSHYFSQETLSRYWGHYQTQYHDVQRCVDDEVPAHVLEAVRKRAKLVEIQLMRDYPPEKVNT